MEPLFLQSYIDILWTNLKDSIGSFGFYILFCVSSIPGGGGRRLRPMLDMSLLTGAADVAGWSVVVSSNTPHCGWRGPNSC